jgi:hypothetical protein
MDDQSVRLSPAAMSFLSSIAGRLFVSGGTNDVVWHQVLNSRLEAPSSSWWAHPHLQEALSVIPDSIKVPWRVWRGTPVTVSDAMLKKSSSGGLSSPSATVGGKC